ncbi:MAG: L,D-transpeptidase family protein [Chitinispirillales bacterium]|jgi:murein L,D-transpeptidase YafK|nr:L,D-transpeptidase family protein [Chitinispirillales bacterium]
MRLWASFNRYLAFKVKEAEFRLHTWRRAKEISRAYDANPAAKLKVRSKIKAAKIKPPREIKPPVVKEPKFRPPKIKEAKVKTPKVRVIDVKPPKVKTPKIKTPRVKAPRVAKHRINAAAAMPFLAKTAKLSAIAVGIAATGSLLVFGAIKVAPLISMPAAAVAASEAFVDTEDIISAYAAIHQEIPEGAILPEAAVLPEGYGETHTSENSASIAAAQSETAAQYAQSTKTIVEIFRTATPRGISATGWMILVDKAAKVMYILKDNPHGWEVARAFPIATGEREGPKRVEGDKKTPQGEYFIVGRKHRSELTNLYGPAAFILDYPNEEDRRAGRTGHGIWIHGSERGNIPPLFTQGCVATSNPDILEIAGMIGNGIGIPVIIVSGTEGAQHLAEVDFNRVRTRGVEVTNHHNERQAEFEELVIAWKTAWETKDIEAYTQFYSTRTFVHGGTQRWEAYRDHKLRTFAMYETINIDVTNIMLTELTRNSATVKFNQLYVTNLNRIENAKRLIFRREQDSWKIHREIPFPKEELLL